MKDFNLGEALVGFFTAYWNLALWIVTVAVGGYAIWKLVFEREDRNITSSPADAGMGNRTWRMLLQMFGNWQLTLLAATSLILSLASGWTTWDGLRNFTREPVLSLMATFGIQGVMLITSWLIGETFARGATGEADRESNQSGRERAMETAHSSFPLLIGAIILGLIVGAASFYWKDDGLTQFSDMFGTGVKWTAVGLGTFLFLAFILVVFSKTDILGNYAQGARVILANLHLWVMLLACMGTSVFFSFDSLFTSIFPQEERVRAAEIRAINQVASNVADTGSLIQKRQMEESEKLFALPAWQAYEKQLDAVTRLAEKAPALIREQITRELEEQKSRVATLEEKRATAQGGQAGLATRKATLTEDLSRLQGQRPTEAAESQADKAKVTETERLFAEQRVKSAAEEKGVEGTGKIGRGQFYRASKAEEDKLGEQLKIARDRLRNSEGRLTATDRRLTTVKAELAQIDGDLAKLRGEAETAGQMISVAQTNNKADAAQRFDPSAGVGSLERERQTFRQKPELAILANVQNACAALLSAAGKVPSLRDEAARIDCDPKEASEAANRVFALNAGIVAFTAHCVGGDKLPQTGGTTALLSFGRKCLQDSGLPSKDSAAIGARLSSVDLNRDDKAHRFVVTWNAFLDGNRLAYLALAIAIALDGLVFMSGLFGANAIASPLSGTPEARRRSVQDLEKVIYSALRPEPVNAADLAVNLMEPVRLPQYPGFTVFVDLNPMVNDTQKFAVRKVLTAGSGLGLVSHVGEYPSIYLIRRELHEYLLKVSGDEHDRGRRPDPVFSSPQLDSSASMARPFLAHYTRMLPQPRGGYPRAPAGLPGDDAMDVTPHRARLQQQPQPRALPSGPQQPSAHAPPATWPSPDQVLPQSLRSPSGGSGIHPANDHGSARDAARSPAAGPRPRREQDDDEATPSAPMNQTDMLAKFTEPLGLAKGDYDILMAGGLDKEITNATYAVEDVANSDKILAERLHKLDQTKRGVIKMISQRHPGSDTLAADLEYNLPSLVLFGSKGYLHVVDMLISQMEGPGGEGKLSLSEDLRYQHLKRHQGEIHRLWNINRRSATGWENLTGEIQNLAHTLAQLSAAEDAKDRVRPHGVPESLSGRFS
jgi:hypothetical protein